MSTDTDDIDDNGDATVLWDVASTGVNITSALYTFGDGSAVRIDDEEIG